MKTSDLVAVPKADWPVRIETADVSIQAVVEAIHAEVSPPDLAAALVEASVAALRAQSKHRVVAFYDEPMGDPAKADYRRACLLIGIADTRLFDQVFNGRGGYRAMFWRGPATGEAFNAMVVSDLVKAVLTDRALVESPIAMTIRASPLLQTSLAHPSAKLWPFFEETWLSGASLDVEGWRDQARGRGLFESRNPLFMVKGAFVSPTGDVEITKISRSEELSRQGWT